LSLEKSCAAVRAAADAPRFSTRAAEAGNGRRTLDLQPPNAGDSAELPERRALLSPE
jgi:hypothetical protein